MSLTVVSGFTTKAFTFPEASVIEKVPGKASGSVTTPPPFPPPLFLQANELKTNNDKIIENILFFLSHN